LTEWITGRNPVFEVLRAQRRQINHLWVAQGVKEQGRLADIIKIARSQQKPIKYVKRYLLDDLDPHHQAVALNAGGYPYSDLESIIHFAQSRNEAIFILLLDQLQDPQNLGTLLRSAEAFGVHGVILPLAHAASITPAVVNASSGATELLRIAQHNIAQAMDRGIGLIIGNEASGLRRLVRDKCDLLMRLPMQGQIDSLNAAVAGSIAVYLARQARGG